MDKQDDAHRQIYASGNDDLVGQHAKHKNSANGGKVRLLYVLNLKLKDQNIQVDVFEGDDILEVMKYLVSTYKIPKDLRDALQIHILRKLEGIIPWSNLPEHIE